MKILVTGSKGFIGKNLICELKNKGFDDIIEYDIESKLDDLKLVIKDIEFIYHLAGINRPKNPSEFMEGNFGFTSQLLELLEKTGNKCPILITSSIQAELDNPYGKSKKAGEELLFDYSKRCGNKVLVYRLPNVFGKWCRPNYNSAVATFCHNIARDIPVQVNDPNVDMNLVYIDDVVHEFIKALQNQEHINGKYCIVPIVHEIKLGKIVELLYSFKEMRKTLSIPNLDNAFDKKLYSTYLSYLPTNDFSYLLKMNVDARGSFTEIIRTVGKGQFSVNISKPGITKGNHWHHTKNEKFLVVSGQGIIRFRKIGTEEIIEYPVSGDILEVVDIPCGYTHNITNQGSSDMVTFMWCNESFDPKNPDTYYEEV